MLPEYQLIHAIRSGCTANFNEAIQRGATMDARDIHGKSVLEIAMQKGRPDTARRLIRGGADPNEAIGKRGDRLIHVAARTGDIGFLTVLLEADVDANAPGNCERTPLHHVVRRGYEFMTSLLFNRQANPDASDAHGNTPLHFAAKTGSLSMIKILLANQANTGVTNHQLYTPIHEAAANGHQEATLIMLSHERAVNPNFSSSDLVRRIARVAELHGNLDLANSL